MSWVQALLVNFIQVHAIPIFNLLYCKSASHLNYKSESLKFFSFCCNIWNNITVKVKFTYFTKVIHLKKISCKVSLKGSSWEEWGIFFSWSILYLPRHYLGHLQHFLWSSITYSSVVTFQCLFVLNNLFF